MLLDGLRMFIFLTPGCMMMLTFNSKCRIIEACSLPIESV